MTNQGWIKSHRSIVDHWVFQDARTYHLWSYFLLSANHQDNKMLFNNQLILVKRGSFITSKRKLIKKTRLHQSTLDRLIRMLENDAMIVAQSDTHKTIITICNYDKYQQNDKNIDAQSDALLDAQPVAQSDARSVHNPLTNKNDNNDKELRKKEKKYKIFRVEDFKLYPKWGERGTTAIKEWIDYKNARDESLMLTSYQQQIDTFRDAPQIYASLVARAKFNGWSGLNPNIPLENKTEFKNSVPPTEKLTVGQQKLKDLFEMREK